MILRAMKVLHATLVLSLLLASCEQPGEAQPSQRSVPSSPVPQAPLEALTDISADGVQAALRAAPGRVLLVNLWSTWCRPCMEEMPRLLSLAAQHRDDGLGSMFISMDIAASRDDALRFMAEQHAPAPSHIRVGRDADFIPVMHGEWSGTLPATILFDESRRPQHIWVGEVPMDELERAVRQMLSEGNEP